MRTYSHISEPVESCPFCKGTKIKYSITTAANGHYYSQCYCDECKAAGPRIRFIPDTTNNKYNTWGRYSAESDATAKAMAIVAWNKR